MSCRSLSSRFKRPPQYLLFLGMSQIPIHDPLDVESELLFQQVRAPILADDDDLTPLVMLMQFTNLFGDVPIELMDLVLFPAIELIHLAAR